MDVDEAGFPQFARLPPELRDQIWNYAFPEARIYEVLDSPCVSSAQRGLANKLMFADVRNEPPPPLARVCRDARQAVLRRYKPLAFSGVVKHINLGRDILLLDSYLQVRRLLKVVRLLSQIEQVRRSMSRIALGTSWGLHAGLHLRLFHKTVRTKQNMTRLLEHLSRFARLESLILVVYQRSAFNITTIASSFPVTPTNHHHHPHPSPIPNMLPWNHYDLCEPYYSRFNVNFNLENYWLRRPYQTKLVQYDPESPYSRGAATHDPPNNMRRHSKSTRRDPQPRGHQVRDLKGMFERSVRSVVDGESKGKGEDGVLGAYRPPELETATFTWVYTGIGYGGLYM
ncbi:hypothetical protein F5Y16DRAFT_393431 [Xylariaceae sp. FL0255]|nr:hypothetical protein F5Y16DRAFT_393431 [Xylariaceae sp. FL0255]